MRSRWVRVDGKLVKQTVQPANEVGRVIDTNDRIRNELATEKTGGAGSNNIRWLGRVPMALDAKWRHEWRTKGGFSGTGLKAHDYVLFKMSLPENSKLVVTPSGRTGFEQKARKLRFFGESSKRASRSRTAKPRVEFKTRRI